MNIKREWCAELGREIEVRYEPVWFASPRPKRVGDESCIFVDSRGHVDVRLLRVNGKLRLVEIPR